MRAGPARAQRGHRQHRQVQRQGDALGDADRQAHAGEGTRPATDGDRIELATRQAGLCQQLFRPRQSELGMTARRQLESLDHAVFGVQRD